MPARVQTGAEPSTGTCHKILPGTNDVTYPSLRDPGDIWVTSDLRRSQRRIRTGSDLRFWVELRGIELTPSMRIRNCRSNELVRPSGAYQECVDGVKRGRRTGADELAKQRVIGHGDDDVLRSVVALVKHAQFAIKEIDGGLETVPLQPGVQYLPKLGLSEYVVPAVGEFTR